MHPPAQTPHCPLRRQETRPWIARRPTLALGALLLLGAGTCGTPVTDGLDQALRTCQDMNGAYHFQALVPPWKYNKEYSCTNYQNGQCLGIWNPTGRYVFVVSDVPFVNFDSEIVSSLEVIRTSGDTAQLVQQLIADEQVDVPGSNARFYGDAEQYPKELQSDGAGGLPGHELLWLQDRTFQGSSYTWYRRDTFLRAPSGAVYQLRFFSIGPLDRPEFEAIVQSFREGPAPDGAPDCPCIDEHDPSGPTSC